MPNNRTTFMCSRIGKSIEVNGGLVECGYTQWVPGEIRRCALEVGGCLVYAQLRDAFAQSSPSRMNNTQIEVARASGRKEPYSEIAQSSAKGPMLAKGIQKAIDYELRVNRACYDALKKDPTLGVEVTRTLPHAQTSPSRTPSVDNQAEAIFKKELLSDKTPDWMILGD